MAEIEIDIRALIDTFVAEASETLGALEQMAVGLEARPADEELVHALFRAAHTLKGSAAIVGFDAVSGLAHELEALLERVRSKAIAVTPDLVTLLLRSVDVLRAGVAHAAAGREEGAEDLAAIRAELGRAGELAPAGAAPAARTLRVDVAKLDRMLDLTGEVGIARGRLTELLEGQAPRSVEELVEAHREADRLFLDLQELIMQARMVPIGLAFHAHLRTVRDVARATGKQVRLVAEGTEVEVDTAIVEGIRDPIMHLVRNAIDHGIELPDERRARGKDATAQLALRASQEGGSVVVEVEDDGAGLDRERIARKAKELGLLADGAGTDEALWRVLFEPGFSTSEVVSDVSGRGVGLDVVRRNVEALRGSVRVSSTAGRGTIFTLRLPLTLAIVQGLRVGVGGETYIVPLDEVSECLDLPAEGQEPSRAVGVLELRGRPLPFVRLRRHLGTPGDPPSRERVVVVQHDGRRAGLAVDTLVGEIQTVVKPLARTLPATPGVSGTSILGDGSVALVLDVGSLLRETLKNAAAPT